MNNIKTPDIDPTWLEILQEEFQKPYMENLKIFLTQELKNHTLFPPMKEVFNAFKITAFDKIKVIILGQDPYHNTHQAHGLCFSVRKGNTAPPSLMNIFTEIKNDLQYPVSPGCVELTPWAQQGVFLLNTVLTVRKNQPGSHRNRGWETFTDQVITLLNKHQENLVFLLWGKFAQQKISLIDASKHLILTAPHPSPFSASRGFFGCRHFSKANQYLLGKNKKTIDWNLII